MSQPPDEPPRPPAFGPAELQAILAALPDPGFILTESGCYAAIYGGTDSRYYHDGSNLVGQRMHDVLQTAKADWFLREIRTALTRGTLHIVEYELSNRDVRGLPTDGPDEPIWYEGRISPLACRINGEAAVLWVASNITQRHLLAEQLRTLSETDDLTGLYNRRKLMAEIGVHFEAFVRYSQPASVVYLDIDHFKALNDTEGHHAGDAALQALARALHSELRKTDLAARLGGDEFVVVCPHTDLAHARTFAQRLYASATAALGAFAAHGRPATVSIGVATTHPGDRSAQDLLRRADISLYDAKRQGRNRVVWAEA